MAFDLGRLLEAKVAFNIHEGAWRWPRKRHRVTHEVMEILKTLLLEINVGTRVNRVSHHFKRRLVALDIHGMDLPFTMLGLLM